MGAQTLPHCRGDLAHYIVAKRADGRRREGRPSGYPAGPGCGQPIGAGAMTKIDNRLVTELEAAAFRKLVDHLRGRTDVQNIDMMNLAGFCRNCLANWYQEEANARGLELSKEGAREVIYGMPFKDWQAKHQKDASAEQEAAFAKSKPRG